MCFVIWYIRKISYSEYHYYATGRLNVHYAMIKLQLKKRQDLFTSVCMDLIWPSKDTVTIEMPLDVPEYGLGDGTSTTSVPIELVIVRRRELKTIFETFPYLKNFVSPTQAKNLKSVGEGNESGKLIVLAETEEHANFVVDAQVGDILSKMGAANLIELHITDQKAYNNA